MRYALYDSISGSGKVYHCDAHEGGAGLEIEERCKELGCEYAPLRLTGADDDIDHQRFAHYRLRLLLDLKRGMVAGSITDPPCETFIGGRFRDAEGPGRMGRTR